MLIYYIQTLQTGQNWLYCMQINLTEFDLFIFSDNYKDTKIQAENDFEMQTIPRK